MPNVIVSSHAGVGDLAKFGDGECLPFGGILALTWDIEPLKRVRNGLKVALQPPLVEYRFDVVEAALNPGESGEGSYALMRLVRKSSFQAATFRLARIESLPFARLIRF